MPKNQEKTSYDGLENKDLKVGTGNKLESKPDPYKIRPEFKGKKKIRKNQIISQERAKRSADLQTSSESATFSNGLWGATFDDKNVFEGSDNKVLQWPYANVEGAKCINVFGRKNKSLSIKAADALGDKKEDADIKQERASMKATDKAAYAIMALPSHNELNQYENFGTAEYEPPKKLKKTDDDFVDVKNAAIPLGMRNDAKIKTEAFKKETQRVQKLSMNYVPKTSKNTYNPSQEDKKRPKVFMDVKVGSAIIGKIVIELFADVTPVTVKNFRAIINNERGYTYQGTKFHRIIPNFMIQGGDFTRGDGTGGYSIYGPRFKDENFTLKHDEPYLMSMANSGPNTNGSQFFITTAKTPWLDGKHTVFGKVIIGQKVVQELERQGSQSGAPRKLCMIYKCGDLDEMTEEARAKWLSDKTAEIRRKQLGLEGEKSEKSDKTDEKDDKSLTPRQKQSRDVIARLTKPGAKYMNLNPWRVMELDHTASDSDVKKAYKKMSLLCHPDRNRDNVELAQTAFDALKKANEILMDTKRKEECLGVLQEAQERVSRHLIKEKEKAAKQAKIEKRDIKVELAVKENFTKAVEKETTKLFADMDMAHKERVQREQVRKAQEVDLENEQLEYAKMCKEYNKNFNESRQQRVDSWYKFEKKKEKKGKKDKKLTSKYKVGTFKPPKRKTEHSTLSQRK